MSAKSKNLKDTSDFGQIKVVIDITDKILVGHYIKIKILQGDEVISVCEPLVSRDFISPYFNHTLNMRANLEGILNTIVEDEEDETAFKARMFYAAMAL